MGIFSLMISLIQKYWLYLTLLLLTVIASLSLWPVAQLPNVPGTDKTHHFIAYAALAFPTVLRKPKNWQILLFVFILFSGLIELIQPFVNRYGEWLDMAANAFGLLCGYTFAQTCLFLQTKISGNNQ